MEELLAAGIFIGAYVFIAVEKVHKTIIALVGASLMLVLGLIEQKEAFFSEEIGIDYNVIFLLIGMMMIINITAKTGLFQWLAIKAAKVAGGHPMRIMLLLALITAVASAFLDNVTTVLLMAPVTIFIASALKVDPVPYLITEVLASNIGGAATLIGDPPNIMIASKAQLTYMDFIVNMAPVIVVVMAVFLVTIRIVFRNRLSVSEERREKVMQMDEREAIEDRALLWKCLVVLALTSAAFVFHSALHLEPATVALAGGSLLFLLAQEEPHEILRDVEWPTIFFFVGLFVMVGAVVKAGIIEDLSQAILDLTAGNLMATSMLVMWISAFASAIVDNIPYVATMNPLIVDMAQSLWPGESGAGLLHHPELLPVWWSLALGACLGGNATIVGASANVIAVGMAEKSGYKITFRRFLLYGTPLMIQSMVISTAYVLLRYYIL
ncbi:MAG: hypothetical protein C4534_07050 [Gaiellales bacterium]|nr:MAG: hypothetical protein C4534_07050 [Gaiellales bacterium]